CAFCGVRRSPASVKSVVSKGRCATPAGGDDVGIGNDPPGPCEGTTRRVGGKRPMPALTRKANDLSIPDLANLRESGRTDETIRANAIRTEGDRLVFPYRDLNGKTNCFTRWRPHHPTVIDGKPAKYLQRKGSPLRAYFPFASLAKLRDGISPV